MSPEQKIRFANLGAKSSERIRKSQQNVQMKYYRSEDSGISFADANPRDGSQLFKILEDRKEDNLEIVEEIKEVELV